MERKLVSNRWETPDGTILESNSRHDYVTHTDTVTGETLFVDGGICYIRRSPGLIDRCVYSTDNHELIRRYFCWGTYGKDGKSELFWIKLGIMDTEHIEAILKTQHLQDYIKKIFLDELEYRNK